MVSFAKYSLVPTEEPKENVAPPPPPQSSGAFDYNSAFSYKSAFDYGSKTTSQYQSAFDYGYGQRGHSVSLSLGEKDKGKKDRFKDWSLMTCLASVVTGLSYFFICITFPVTLWFCFKKIAQWERLIVFRLGRLRGALGPGIVFIIPWLDRHNRVDMRTKAFSVPPQQLITSDNGIIEMGCEVKYRISDVQRLTTSVTSPEHGLRSFGKTVMLNVLTKHTVRETERDRPIIASQIQKELNLRVLEWGIEIGDVSLSNVNILKEAEPHNPLKPLMNCFGGKGGEIVAPPGATAAAASSILNMPGFPGMGDFSFVNTGPSKKKSEAIVTGDEPYMGRIQQYLTDLLGFSDEISEPPKQPNIQANREPWNWFLEPPDWPGQPTNQRIQGPKLINYLTNQVIQRRFLMNVLHSSDWLSYLTNQEPLKLKEIIMIPLTQILVNTLRIYNIWNKVWALFSKLDFSQFYTCMLHSFRSFQVLQVYNSEKGGSTAIGCAQEDLMAIFEGTLAPLQAYLSGHLTVQGNIQMLMGLETLRQTTKDKDKEDIFVV
ncbi:stomatin-like protein 1 [Penaeus vannamei]|uniref:stomatin-like protein 1 n=1 Tax=Penaeus vannamei TaxID=6689 RepID=UPI00387F8EDE